jgi:hypothetical protein
MLEICSTKRKKSSLRRDMPHGGFTDQIQLVGKFGPIFVTVLDEETEERNLKQKQKSEVKYLVTQSLDILVT